MDFIEQLFGISPDGGDGSSAASTGPALAHGGSARIARAVGLRRKLRMISAWTIEGHEQLLAPRRDRLRGGFRALLDPLHQRIERRGELRPALSGVLVFIRIGLHQPIPAVGGMDRVAIGGLHFDGDLRVVDRFFGMAASR